MTALEAVPNSEDFERTPPHDLAAEQCVLGGMLMSQAAIEDVIPVIKPMDHYRPAHQMVHEAVLHLYDAGEPVDAVTVSDLMATWGTLARAGGGAYLHTLIASVPTAANAGFYARIVRKHAGKRRAVEVGTRIVQIGYADAISDEDAAELARAEVDKILTPATSTGVQDIGDLFYEVLGKLESGQPRGLPTPWADVNNEIPGFAPGELIVIGASSGTGKSLAGLQICADLSLRHGVPTVIFTMEMTRQEVMLRLIASEARVPLEALTYRKLTDDHWALIDSARDKITSSPLVIDDTPAMSAATIRGRLREMARSHAAGLVFVDYLGLLREPDGAENRQNAVAANTRALKAIGTEFGIPVVAAAQLNREMEHRSNKRPQPSDLRDSAEIEHAATVIILLYREDVHGEETDRAGEIDFIIAKNRNGRPANVTLLFQGSHARCVDPVREWSPSRALGDPS